MKENRSHCTKSTCVGHIEVRKRILTLVSDILKPVKRHERISE